MAIAEIRLRWDFSPEEIKQKVQQLIDDDKKVLDEIAALSPDQLTEATVIGRLGWHELGSNPLENNLGFLQHVHPDPAVREASTEADRVLSDHGVEMQMRKDVFDNLVKFQLSPEGKSLTGEAKRLIDRLVANGRRNGLHLDQEQREKIKTIKKRLSEISIDFQKNCNDESTTFEFTKDQLQGMPDDFLEPRLNKEKGTPGLYTVSLKYPDYFPVQKNCVVPETRRILERGFHSRCKEVNAPLLEESARLRHQRATILGFANHADYALELRMAKNQCTVLAFLRDLTEKLRPSFEVEKQRFLQYKREEAEKFGFEDDGKIHMWDFRHYMNVEAERFYSVDHEKLKEYFPEDVVTEGLLDIYQTLLHLKFTRVHDGPVWHPSVTMYKVTEAGADDTLVGFFYLDLFPRPNKYNHAACFTLQSYGLFKDGSVQYPAAAMVANFPPALSPDQPALFTHEDVETYFHEFGHVMHTLCARTRYPQFAGSRVERDFVEAPSQMLENWVWHPDSLARLSRHYKDGSSIPGELVDKLVASKKANAGIFNLRQVMLSTFDQVIHSKEESDCTAEYAAVCEAIMGVGATPGTCMPASFEHLIDGYDAQYYGYLWSEVYSADMFLSRFGKEGVLNPETGRSYRTCILQPGGSVDAMHMLTQFLGRPPNTTAFLVSKGLQPDAL